MGRPTPQPMRHRSKVWWCLALLLLPLAQAELVTRITLTDVGVLEEADLGVLGGAVSPDGEMVLLHGMGGYVHLVSADKADDRTQDIDLSTGRSSDVNDVAWHPRGNTALLVGDEGLAMRYDTYDHSITHVNGTFAVIGQSLTAVVWRPSGDFAYVAAEDGTVWKFAEHTGFERLNNTGTSRVMDVACHRNHNICFIATVDEGLAVIDQGFTVRWMAQSASETWVGVDCVDPNLNECTAYASGLRSKVINVNLLEPSQSTVGSTFAVDLLEGEQTGVSPGNDRSSLVHVAPLGLVRYEPLSNSVFTVLVPEDAVAFDATIAGRAMAVVWENGEHDGFFITEYGNVVAFSPATEAVDSSILTVLVLGAVAISVPGVLLGLLYMNSPWLQRKYNDLRFGKKAR